MVSLHRSNSKWWSWKRFYEWCFKKVNWRGKKCKTLWKYEKTLGKYSIQLRFLITVNKFYSARLIPMILSLRRLSEAGIRQKSPIIMICTGFPTRWVTSRLSTWLIQNNSPMIILELALNTKRSKRESSIPDNIPNENWRLNFVLITQ